MPKANFILSGPTLIEKWNYSSAGEYFFEKIPKFGTATALVNGKTGEETSYKQLFEKSLKLSLSLEKLGLKINDRIGICSENSPNFGATILSSIFLGTTICLFNPSYTERELIHALAISKPKCIFLSKSVLEKMQKIVRDLELDLKLILLEEDAKILNLDNLIAEISDDELGDFKLPTIDKTEHVLIIAFSSGTTGLPKGVMLTDKNILSALEGQVQNADPLIKRNAIVSGLLPMFHIYGLDVFLITIVFNSTLVIFPRFEEKNFLNAVEKYRIDTLFLVPTIFVILSKSLILGEYDLSSVQYLISAAAVLSSKVAEAFLNRLNISRIYNVFGMTETSCTVTYSSADHEDRSIGFLQPGCIAKVIPVDGNSKEPLGPNRDGELCFKGDLIMKGYCEDKEATEAAIDEDGFLHSGDVGHYDEEERFYVVDRLKEIIKYKGFQVPPAELEAILLSHPGVKDAAVVGLPDELAGELPLAFVVLQPGVSVSSVEIIQYVNDQVSPAKKLRGGVRFVEAIPKNSTGKILRRELRNCLKNC